MTTSIVTTSRTSDTPLISTGTTATHTNPHLTELNSIKEELKTRFQILKAIPATSAEEETSRKEQEICIDLLYRLTRIPMTRRLLEESKAGKVVHKLATKLPDAAQYSSTLVETAQILLLQWKAAAGCLGLPSVALQEFRKRQKELEREGQAKPDMVAYKELRRRGRYRHLSDRRHGLLEDVPIGVLLRGRGEAAILGIHTNILSGIDSEKDQPCFAVCLSGKYDDRESYHEDGERDGTLLYTGMGGLKNNRQVEDQTENPANASLIQSSITGDPVRVLRRVGETGTTYRYEGLYQCTDYTYGPCFAGPKVYRFTLRPIPYQSTFCFRRLKSRPPSSRSRSNK